MSSKWCPADGRKKKGRTPAPPKAEPDGEVQRNFTGPESRILKTQGRHVIPVGENDRLVGMITDRDIAVPAVAA